MTCYFEGLRHAEPGLAQAHGDRHIGRAHAGGKSPKPAGRDRVRVRPDDDISRFGACDSATIWWQTPSPTSESLTPVCSANWRRNIWSLESADRGWAPHGR